jgi:hypothetical protein
VRDLALQYESGLEGLHRVFAVGGRLEDPAEEPELRKAVIANFKRRIPYIFAVSRDRFESEQTVNGYYDVFRTYARRALEESGEKGALEPIIRHLVRIVPLTHNWDQVPIVFYHCVIGRQTFAYAFRGNQVGHGIANGYVCVGHDEAAIIYQSVAQAIQPDYRDLVDRDLAQVTLQNFEEAPAPKLRLAK